MTGPEKRYYKVFIGKLAPGAGRDQKALFDAIAAMETFDEASLLIRFQGQRSLGHFTTIKHRLYDAVLRSLAAFHTENSVDARLDRLLHQVDILHDKALYSDADRLLTTARRLAETHGKHICLLRILRYEQRALERDNYAHATPQAVAELLVEGHDAVEQEGAIQALWNLKSKVFMGLYRNGQARNAQAIAEVDELIKHPLLSDQNTLHSPRASFLFHHIRGAANFATGKVEACGHHLKEALDVLETNQGHFKEDPNLAFSTLSNLIYVHVHLGEYQLAQDLLKEFRTMPGRWEMPETADLDLKLFATSTSLELTIHNRLGGFDKVMDLLAMVERGLEKYGDDLSPIRKASIFYQVAYAHFGAGKPDIAIRWLHRLLNDIRIDESAEIVCFARILNLLAYLDARELGLLPYALRNTARFLSTRDRMHRFEPILLAMVRKLMKARTPENRIGIHRGFLESILPLENDPFERTVFDHLDPIAWAESRITGRPFAELVQERARRHVFAA